MREIKFRAWDADAGEMIYSDKDYTDTYFFEFVDHKLKCIGIDPDGFPGDQWSPPGPSSYVIENIMQYTGLKDRNGREIYEGDVVRYKTIFGFDAEEDYVESDQNIIEVDAVKFKYGDFTPREEGYFPEDGFYAWRYWDFEVIGNIYENPELLK